MLKLSLAPELVARLHGALREAGHREIGGLLMGEHFQDNHFQIVDLSVQTSGGDTGCFVRGVDEHTDFVRSFFERTGYDYARFNYLGEWHSHPSFSTAPSSTDLRSMQDIVEEPGADRQFAVLIIVKLRQRQVVGQAYLFQPQQPAQLIELHIPPRASWAVRLYQRLPFIK